MRISDWSSDVCSSDLLQHQGTRLMLKGPTGAANDFSLTTVSSTTDGTTGADLSQFAFSATTPPAGSRMSSATEPKDAVILLDGVEQHYAGNTIDGAIPYLRIDLNKAAPGTNVTQLGRA